MSDSSSFPPPQPVTPQPPVPPARKGMSTGCIIGLVVGIVGFFVLVIVAILASLAIPAFNKSQTRVLEKARALQAKATMKSFEMAVKGYQTEYNRLPSIQSPPPTADNSQGLDTTSDEGKRLIQILMGTDTQNNPRGIGFYEPPQPNKSGGGYTSAGGLVDIWGAKGYIIIFDYDGDGNIADPEHAGVTVSESVIIYSAGPDGDFSTWKDNVTSWGP